VGAGLRGCRKGRQPPPRQLDKAASPDEESTLKRAAALRRARAATSPACPRPMAPGEPHLHLSFIEDRTASRQLPRAQTRTRQLAHCKRPSDSRFRSRDAAATALCSGPFMPPAATRRICHYPETQHAPARSIERAPTVPLEPAQFTRLASPCSCTRDSEAP
jgi:hypothetical protein